MNRTIFYHRVALASVLAVSLNGYGACFANEAKTVPTAAAEKDARDIVQTIGKGADMAGHAIASTAERVRANNQGSEETLPQKGQNAQKGLDHFGKNVSSTLDELREKTENGGRAIASAVKGPAGNESTNGSKIEPSKGGAGGSNSWNQTLSDMGRGITQAMAGVENFLKEMGQKARGQLAKSENERQSKK